MGSLLHSAQVYSEDRRMNATQNVMFNMAISLQEYLKDNANNIPTLDAFLSWTFDEVANFIGIQNANKEV